MRFVLALITLLALATSSRAGKRYYYDDVAPCRAPENFRRPHRWLDSERADPWEPVDERTPMSVCKRRDIRRTCEKCLSTFIVAVEFEGPGCPKRPPANCK